MNDEGCEDHIDDNDYDEQALNNLLYLELCFMWPLTSCIRLWVIVLWMMMTMIF